MATLRFLLLEAKLQDTEAIQAALTSGGIAAELRRVDTRTAFVRALETEPFDLILAAYAMPGLAGMAALTLARGLCADVPFIFVSTSLGEELAIETLKRGATDYVLKQRLGRLVPCVQRALQEAQERRKRQQAERLLVEQKRLLELIAFGRSLEECLAAVCATIAQLNPHARASFLLADAQRQFFPSAIAPDFPLSFWQGLKDAPINDLCIGTCGEAVYRGHPVTCADMAHDDRWSDDWRNLCVAHGVLACHSTPVLGADGLPLGALMLAFDAARLPTEWEYQLADFGVQVASLAFERDRANAALRESEAKYRTLFESIDEGFCLVEVLFEADGRAADHRILQANAAFGRHTGILDPQGKTASELAPGLEQYWNDLYAQVIHTGESVRLENRSDALDRWFDVLVWRVDHASCQVAIVFTDITERKRAEALLQASHDTFRHLVEHSPFGVYTVDADFRLAQVSAGAQKIFANIHPLIGRDFAAILRLLWTEPFASEALAHFRHTLETGEPYHSPSTIERRHDINAVESYDWKLERLTLLDGRYGVVCHFYDLSERQHYEAALRASEERFHNMADNAPVMIWVTDPTGACTYLSRSWYDLTGQTEETGLGFGWLSRVHPDDFELVQQLFLTANQRQEAFALEYRLQRQDGEYIWAIDAASPWFGGEGQFKGYIGSVLDISERKQAEQTLRQREERYRTLFESIDEGFCVVELLFDQNHTPIDYRVLEVNPTFEQQTGLHQAVGKTARQLNIEEHWIEIYGQVALTGEPVRFENGSEILNRWFDVYACCTGEPEARKVAIVFKDISDRKQAEELLRRAAEVDAFRVSLTDALRLLADPVEIQAAASRVLGEYLGANRVAYFEVRGADYVVERDYVNGAEALAGSYPIDSFGSKLLTAYRRGRAVFASEVATDANLSPDQRSAYAAIQIGAYIGIPLVKGGEFVAGLAVHTSGSRDWTPEEMSLAEEVAERTWAAVERARAEAALSESENRLRLALKSAELGTWDFNPLTGVLQWDDQCKAMFGLPPASAINYDRFLAGLHPEDRERTDQVVQSALNPESNGEYEIEYRTIGIEDGVERWIAAKGKAFFNPAGIAVRFIGTVLNITEQKRAEAEREQLLQREQAAREEAERANRIKDEFLAVLSHELRSPLNPILGWSKLLQNSKLDAAKTQQALKTIERNAQLQAELIEDLLDVSRILQGKLNLNVSSINLVFIIRAAMETVRLAAEAKSIKVEASFEPGVVLVSGDATRLQQVVWNFLSNAVKFTPTGGQVSIRLECLDSYAQITVSDTGQGIEPDFLPHVFDYFRQADGTTTRKFGGLGLGLAIVRHLVELHGGTVQAASPGAGKGATFMVRLPLLSLPTIAPPKHQLSALASDLHGIQVLVVDDEPDSREFVAFVLEQAGATVLTATNTADVLTLLMQATPNVLLSDIGMPEMDGYTLMRQVRALPTEQGGQVPAIALTAYAGEIDRQQALAAGFQRHLTKPIEPEALVSAIVQMTAQSFKPPDIL